MNSTAVKLTLITIVLASISGCGLWNKGTQYQVPDYYETSLIVAKPVTGKTYYINDLRCSEQSGGCHQEKVVQHRRYEKPYYLSR